MNEPETLIAWAKAICAREYDGAIALLQTHLDQPPNPKSPLTRQMETLLSVSRVWAKAFDEPEDQVNDESCPEPKKFKCSFCGQDETENRKLILGPYDAICNLCTKEFVERFAAMK